MCLSVALRTSNINFCYRDLWSVMAEPVEEEDDDDYDEDFYDDLRVQYGVNNNAATSSKPDSNGEESDRDFLAEDEDEDVVFRDPVFCKNILELVVTAAKEGHPVDSTLLEIKGLKFAQNKVMNMFIYVSLYQNKPFVEFR